MINRRFGWLTVICDAPSIKQSDGGYKRAVTARCDCGTEKIFAVTNLKSGNSKSCGCRKYRGIVAANAERAIPQKWNIDGAIAWIELNGHKVIVDIGDVVIVERYRWYMDESGYIDSMQCEPMHRLLLGLKKGDPREVDHRNHIPWDNRRAQIRIASSSQNKMNGRGKRTSTSKYKGVHFDKQRNRFVAQIKTNGQQRLIGRFVSETEAALAYNAEARHHFGEFAYLNAI
jgi:hypothetical protein